MHQQVLVETKVYLPRPELFQGDIIVYAPQEEVALEVVAGGPDLRLHGEEEVLYQLLLLHRLGEVVFPPEGEPGGDDGAGMSEQENDGHTREVCAQPAQQQVGPYVLDQAPSCDEPPVEPVRPGIPELAREREPGRFQELLAPVFWPQVLLAPEVPEGTHLSRVEGL